VQQDISGVTGSLLESKLFDRLTLEFILRVVPMELLDRRDDLIAEKSVLFLQCPDEDVHRLLRGYPCDGGGM